MKRTIKKLFKKTPVYHCFADYFVPKRFQVLTEDEKQCCKFYQQFIKPGDLVFDVGANMGSRSKAFLNLGARVVAFEPQKVCSDFLKLALKKEERFTLVEAALGDKEGEAEMLISNAHTISTLSPHWAKATKESGRFSQYKWSDKQNVHVTTLDNAIREFGEPSFIKVDVEGFELNVLSGLTSLVRFISIEYASENMDSTYECIDYISSLSDVSFQFSTGESMEFCLPAWVSAEEIKNVLAETVRQYPLAWGDVYMRNMREEKK